MMQENKKKGLKIRIASGKLRGQVIQCPPGEIRPMTSMCKQALFNILYGWKNVTMLDLYSGSGSISIEGYSRGVVEKADIVEADYQKKSILEANIEKFGLREKFNIFLSDAINFIKRTKNKYDIIMADPPFKMENKEIIVQEIINNKILNEDGVIVIHLKKKEVLPEIIEDFVLVDRRNYGINSLAFYRNKKFFDKKLYRVDEE